MNTHLIDEILESVWIAEEDGNTHVNALVVDCTHDVGEYDLPDCLVELEKDGLITLHNDQVGFTEAGRKRGRNLIRRHRLAQRLLMDVLDVSEEMSQEMACKFEHVLNSEVTDRVDAFLGHPGVDPNNRIIPPSDDPVPDSENVAPLVSRLARLGVGKRARVAFLTPSFHKRFDRLAAFGLNPGAELTLHQRKPAYVVRLGETELALDSDIANEIFVRPLS